MFLVFLTEGNVYLKVVENTRLKHNISKGIARRKYILIYNYGINNTEQKQTAVESQLITGEIK